MCDGERDVRGVGCVRKGAIGCERGGECVVKGKSDV